MYLVWVLCEPAEDLQASVPSASGLSVVSVLLSGTLASPLLWAERDNTLQLEGLPLHFQLLGQRTVNVPVLWE